MPVEELPILLSLERDRECLILRIDEGGWTGRQRRDLPVRRLRCENVSDIAVGLQELQAAVGLECEVEESTAASGQVEVNCYINFHVDSVQVLCTSTSSERDHYRPEDVEFKLQWLFLRYSDAEARYGDGSAMHDKYRRGLEGAMEDLLARAQKKLEHYEQKGKGQSFRGEVLAYEKALKLIRVPRG